MSPEPHIFTATMTLPLAREQVFAFFAEAQNLERITPPELGFRIASHTPVDITTGTQIDYHLCLFGLPLWLLGEIALPLIRLQLKRIFSYRQKAIHTLLLC